MSCAHTCQRPDIVVMCALCASASIVTTRILKLVSKRCVTSALLVQLQAHASSVGPEGADSLHAAVTHFCILAALVPTSISWSRYKLLIPWRRRQVRLLHGRAVETLTCGWTGQCSRMVEAWLSPGQIRLIVHAACQLRFLLHLVRNCTCRILRFSRPCERESTAASSACT